MFAPKRAKLSPAQIPLWLQAISLLTGQVEPEAKRPEPLARRAAILPGGPEAL